MKMKQCDVKAGALIKADIYSRPNAMNGKYKACQLGLDDLGMIRDDDVFFLESMKMKADLADKIIAEAELQGKDTADLNVMKELGEKINASGNQIHRSESIMTAIFVSLQLMVYYGIAIGAWGLVFKKTFLWFFLYGAVGGLLISLIFVAPVISGQRTKERIKDMVFAAGSIWGNIGILIGIIGIIVWVVRVIIFR